MDFSKPRSFAAKAGGMKLDSLLGDPTLVDDYKDILRLKPPRDESTDGSSAMGSVVVTPAATEDSKQLGDIQEPSIGEKEGEGEEEIGAGKLVKNEIGDTHSETVRSSMISKTSSRYSVGSDSYQRPLSDVPPAGNDNGHEEEIELEFNDGSSDDETYNYSDSDFEENLQERMKNIDVTSAGSFGHEMEDGDGDMTYHESNGDIIEDESLHHGVHGLELESSDDDNEGVLDFGDDDIDEDTLEEEEDYRPLPPPKELDPDKLYALYPFNGPDASHCQLEQDEACILLNDQDAYWWLVKRCSDKKIGFAPAEILETFPERLARLNCWKNENVSTHSFIRSDGTIERIYDDLSDEELNRMHENDESSVEGSSKDSTPVKTADKNNKSVSFNDVVEYANRFIDEDYSGSDSIDMNELNHHDEYSEGQLEENHPYRTGGIIDADDVSEVNSDVSFGTNNMTPLNIKKVRVQPSGLNDEVSDNPDLISDKEEDSTVYVNGLRKDGLGRNTSIIDENSKTIIKNENNAIEKEQESHSSEDHTNDLSLSASELSSNQEGHKPYKLKDLNHNDPHFAKAECSSDGGEEEALITEGGSGKDEILVDDTIFKVFEAPNMPFVPNHVGMSNSNSNYSISTIGEYSPSSGEFAVESPISEKIIENNAIPTSKAVRDITDLIKSDEECQPQNIPIEGNEGGDEHTDDTSVSSINDENAFDMDDANHELGSSTSINSAFSASKNMPSRSGSSITSETGKHHPIVQALYSPIFLQMDSLLQQLDDLVK